MVRFRSGDDQFHEIVQRHRQVRRHDVETVGAPELPAHHNLEAYLDAYIEAAGIRDDKNAPLFRSTNRRTGTLTGNRMHRVDAWRMVQRRAPAAGLIVHVGNHSFRATGITAYLNAGGTLENAQAMAAHESPRTTKLYDRTGDEITLDEIERITI